MTVAIIPARGGSKGLPGKNWMLLGNHPLVAYPVKLAQNSINIDQIILTTDSAEIEKAIKPYINEITTIHRRPEQLAQDNTSMIDVIIDVINSSPKDFDEFILLQPTSPFRKSNQLKSILEQKMGNSELIVSFEELSHGYSWLYTIESNTAKPISENISPTRQEDKNLYTLNGAFYRCHVNQVLNENKIFYGDIIPYVMNTKTSIDIDTEFDFELARYLLASNQIELFHMN